MDWSVDLILHRSRWLPVTPGMDEGTHSFLKFSEEFFSNDYFIRMRYHMMAIFGQNSVLLVFYAP